MAYKISEDCVKCGAYSFKCPVEAIHEGENQFYIDSESCIECGACTEIFCPAYAISKDAYRRNETAESKYSEYILTELPDE